jgi:uncharacterized protein YkwD
LLLAIEGTVAANHVRGLKRKNAHHHHHHRNPSAAPTGSSAGNLTDEQYVKSQVYDIQNAVRPKENQLSWDTELAQMAKEYADSCTAIKNPSNVHSSWSKEHGHAENIGEYTVHGMDMLANVEWLLTNAWLNEDSAGYWGHLKTIKNVKFSAIGCGAAYCNEGSSLELVCRYSSGAE